MIKSYTGPMHSGKTAAMINEYMKIWNKEHIMCFKPAIDKRDTGIIRSKSTDIEIEAICIDSLNDILDHINDDIKTIFIDEAQLLKGDVSILTYLSVEKDIDIYLAGLNMTSEQEPFLIMPNILAVSDEVYNIKASCYYCGREAGYTCFDIGKTEVIVVGDEHYIPLCASCLKKRKESIN